MGTARGSKRISMFKLKAIDKINEQSTRSWNDAISCVRASLINYPDLGGGSVIMEQVERLCKEAYERGYEDGAQYERDSAKF